MSPEVIELTDRSTEDAARARADRIRRGIHDYLETVAEIALAYERRDWAVLGYTNWQAYVDGEFGAERLKLPTEHRQKAVAELRLAGMSARAIGTALAVDEKTVRNDLRGADISAPAEVRGADGKTYAATRPTPTAPPAATAGLAPADRVWIATARKGIAGHALKSSLLTKCSRATRTGLTLTAQQALDRWEATWCRACWPEEKTTRFAAGETALAGPAAEADDPPASREAGAEIRGSAPAGTPTETAAGDSTVPADGADTTVVDETPAPPVVHPADVAAPAPAPLPSSLGGGAGVTPADPDEPRLPVDQIARLRAVFDWARAGLARHPRNQQGRGRPDTLGVEYAPAEPSPPPPGGERGRVAYVEVSWADGALWISYRSERYELGHHDLTPVDVDQAIDLLCALGLIPARFSRQYAAGVQAGLRAGDAIDGEWTEGHPDE